MDNRNLLVGYCCCTGTNTRLWRSNAGAGKNIVAGLIQSFAWQMWQGTQTRRAYSV